MNQKKQKQAWSAAGLFIIMLVLSMPFYSADALAASVQITKNQGEENLETFIDAQGDVWTVEALITGTGASETIDPESVRLKIGSNDAAFSSCSSSSLGMLCEYISPLTDGVKEAEHAFQVIYNFINAVGQQDSVSNGGVIKADGSPPSIKFFTGDVKQNAQGKVEIDFDVDDTKTGVPAVGLKKIDILDADTGEILQTVTDFTLGQQHFNYRQDTQFEGLLQAQLSGEGKKRIKIRAEDRLGHLATSPFVRFDADFVAPQIAGELNLTKFGEFIGQSTSKTDIRIEVIETSEPSVLGYSDQAALNGNIAECDSDETIDNLWHCYWNDIEVKPESTISVLVVVKDAAGNKVEKTVSKTLIPDTSPPKIKFFGTERLFDDQSYINGQNVVSNRIVLEAEDSGAGITIEGIRANLGAFGDSNAERPTECTEEGDSLVCFWEVDENLEEGVLTFGLSVFEDNVGNDGDMPEFEFFVDNIGPKVEEIEIFGLSEVGDKDYLQSNDILKITFTASESSGLTILVDVNDLVLDAETKFPENRFTEGFGDGWQVFDESSCERVQGKWECSIETAPIKSGPASNELLEIKIQDTAGNDAISWEAQPQNIERVVDDGEYRVNILGLRTEDNPDYWEVRTVVPVGGSSAFIDLDTTPLTFARLPFRVVLEPSDPAVTALNIELASCISKEEAQTAAVQGTPEQGAVEQAPPPASASPAISRSLLYGGISSQGDNDPMPNIILEFEPFDGRSVFPALKEVPKGSEFKHEVEYVCQLAIFSKFGKNAIQNAEIQEVRILVPFGFSALGALDENLAEEITKAREEAEITILEVIGVLAEILKWIDYIVQVYQLVLGAINLVLNAINGLDRVYGTPGEPAGVAACFGMTSATASVQGSMSGWTDSGVGSAIDTIIQVLSCRATPDKLGWYGQWQSYVRDFYNLAAQEVLAGKGRYLPASDIKQNLFLSIAGLCLPGIIKNIDEYRQIKCRKIVCLEQEVAAGLATVESCQALESLLTCKYVLGELWYLIPFAQFYDQVVRALYNALRDPLATLHALTILGCGVGCTIAGTTTSFCNYAYYFWDVIGYIESIAGFVTTLIAEFDQGGLQYCDSVL